MLSERESVSRIVIPRIFGWHKICKCPFIQTKITIGTRTRFTNNNKQYNLFMYNATLYFGQFIFVFTVPKPVFISLYTKIWTKECKSCIYTRYNITSRHGTRYSVTKSLSITTSPPSVPPPRTFVRSLNVLWYGISEI